MPRPCTRETLAERHERGDPAGGHRAGWVEAAARGFPEHIRTRKRSGNRHVRPLCLLHPDPTYKSASTMRNNAPGTLHPPARPPDDARKPNASGRPRCAVGGNRSASGARVFLLKRRRRKKKIHLARRRRRLVRPLFIIRRVVRGGGGFVLQRDWIYY